MRDKAFKYSPKPAFGFILKVIYFKVNFKFCCILIDYGNCRSRLLYVAVQKGTTYNFIYILLIRDD